MSSIAISWIFVIATLVVFGVDVLQKRRSNSR